MKNQNQKNFWKEYIAQARLHLWIAAYTKVPQSWNDDRYTPEVNKFYYIMEGEGYVQVRDQTYYPKPGELYLLPAGVVQSYGTISEQTFGKYWCHFSAKLGDHNLFQVLETPAFIRVGNPERIRHCFEQLVHYYNNEQITAGLRIHALLLELIAEFIEQSEEGKLNMAAAPSFEKMNTVLKYIEEHLSDNISVERLAQLVHFHPNYFIQVFKQFTGFSPIQYINRSRLEKARQLLIVTEWNVSQIAETVGMDLPYFSRMFKEHSGFSPTSYREMIPRAPKERPKKRGRL